MSNSDFQGGAFAETLPQAHDFLANQNIMALSKVDDDLISHLGSESKAVQNELTELRAKASKLKEELEAIWKHENKVEYELTSVFVHRGSSPSWGHYFFYSRCLPDQPDVWFKYNDSEVTQVKKEEVLADTTGSTANPYLVCYISFSYFFSILIPSFRSSYMLVKAPMWYRRLIVQT